MKKTYFTMEPSFEAKSPPASRRRGSKADSTSDDTEGSLDYSSGNSTRSTDSSFADILKVLEGPEMTADLANYLKQQQKPTNRDDKSIAESSLAYSYADGESQMMRSHFTGGGSLAYSAMTDGESHMVRSHWTGTDASTLQGADFVTTIPGPLSDSSTGGTRQPPPTVDGPLSINDQLLFSPAEHEDSMKLRKQRKKQRKHEQKLRQLHEQQLKERQEQQLKDRQLSQTPPQHKPPSPLERPPKSSPVSHEDPKVEEDDIWYAKWWVLCFPEFQIRSKP